MKTKKIITEIQLNYKNNNLKFSSKWVEWTCNTVPTKTKFKNPSFYWGFFLPVVKIFNEVFNECSMKFENENKTHREVKKSKMIHTA